MPNLRDAEQTSNLVSTADRSAHDAGGTSSTLAIISKNALVNLIRQSAAWVIVLLLPPLLVRVLDKPSYATWVLILQISAYVSLFDGGVQSAIARFVARAHGLSDHRYMARILSSAGLILLAGSVLATLLVLLLSWRFSQFFHGIPPSISADASRALLVVGLSLAVSLPFSTLAGIFAGLQRNEVNAFAGTPGKYVGAIGAGWAAYHHQGLIVMALWVGFGNLLQPILYFISWRRLTPHIRIGNRFVDVAGLKEFTQFWSAMVIAQFGTILITGLDMPIVVAFDFRSAAYYAVATTISNMLVVPHSGIISTLMPVAAAMSVGDSAHRMGEILLKTTRYATAILCMISIPVVFGIHPFLRLWVGADYADQAFVLSELLIAAQLIRIVLLPYAVIGFSVGQQNRMLVSPFVEGIVNLLCSLVAVRYMGAIGVAVGTLIGAVVGVWIHFTNSMPRTDLIVFSRRRLVVTGIAKPILYLLPSVAIIALLAHNMAALYSRILLVAFAELLAAWALWNFNFDAIERRALVNLLRRALRLSEPAYAGEAPKI